MQHRTQVLFFHTASSSYGGGSKMLFRLLKSLDRDIFNPIILSQYKDELCKRAERIGISVKIVPFQGVLDTYNRRLLSVSLIEAMQLGVRVGQFNAEIWQLLRGSDVVWCKNLRALLTLTPYALFSQTPIIWNIGLGLESDGKIEYLNSLALQLADEIFIESLIQAKSIFTENQFQKYENKFTVFHKGIDTKRFSPENVESEQYSTFRVGTAASLTPRKGLEHFIDAATKINDAVSTEIEFLIAGEPSAAEDEEYVQSLQDRVKQAGLENNVQFLGWINEMPEYLESLDVFVLPSLNEGIPGVVREALAMEIPVVATDVGGTPEAVLDGETGLLVPPKDSAAIANCVIQLLLDSHERRRMGKKGRQHIISEFSMQGYTEQYHEFLFTLATKD